MTERILVIKLSALGDLVLCFRAFQSIRAAHPAAEIALLTMPAFAGFAKQMPWFDRVLTDPRPSALNVVGWGRLMRRVRAFAPTCVYDFQGKPRQSVLFHLLGKPEWSGAAKGCSHPRPWPPEKGMHHTDFIAAQLESAGVPFVSGVDLSWLDASIEEFDLPERYALFIPGCAPQHPHKRWPPAYYAELADWLRARGIESLAIGTAADADSIHKIIAAAPHVRDLSSKTSLKQVATLARQAIYVVGNDTGPTHLAAAVGARTLALMSEKVDPHWSSPRGPRTTWLQGKPLGGLKVSQVIEALES